MSSGGKLSLSKSAAQTLKSIIWCGAKLQNGWTRPGCATGFLETFHAVPYASIDRPVPS